MPHTFGCPLRGAEHTSTSGRPSVAGNAYRVQGLRRPPRAASLGPADSNLSGRLPARAQRRRGVPLRSSANGNGNGNGSNGNGSANGTPMVSVEEDTWNSRDTLPHPSPPEDLNPTDMLGGCTVEDLATQVHALTELVQTQQDILYSQKAQIDQLTETLQEELRMRNGGSGSGSGSRSSTPGVAASADEVTSTLPPLRTPRRQLTPFEMQRVGYGDRRLLGLYDARFHSTHSGATPSDFRILPDRIILVRHAESEGNVDNVAYTYIPDSQVPLTARGHMQAREAGRRIKGLMEADPERRDDYRLFFYISPYKRSLQTYEGISSQFSSHHLLGVQEEVQLREQDFGNFQDQQGKQREKAERLRFGRFFYRFPNGESGADVYDRITIFEDHMIRDINAGRFADNTALVLVSHGLALRIFMMRWFHWTVDEFLSVYNPGNAEPLVLERSVAPSDASAWRHTKSLYRLSDESMRALKGCTSEMCSTDHLPRKSLKVSTRLL